MNAVTAARSSHNLPAHRRRSRLFGADWSQIEKLIGGETNKSLRIDLKMPRALLESVSAAFMDCSIRGQAPSVQNILAGLYRDDVIEDFENVVAEARARKTPRILLPLINGTSNPIAKILADLFKDPVVVSAKLQKPAHPYELELIGKDKMIVQAPQPATSAPVQK